LIYSIRIGFLLAIFSVIIGAGIYQGLTHSPQYFPSQPQRILHAEKKVISPAVVSFQPRHSVLSLSMLMGQTSPDKPFFIIRINDIQQVIPSYDNVPANFAYVRSKSITISILELSQPLFDLQAQGVKALWPNSLRKAIRPVVTEQTSFSRIQLQNVEIPVLKYTPLFSNGGHAIKLLRPHRYLSFIRRRTVFAQAPLPPPVQSRSLAIFFPTFIQSFDFLNQDIAQVANTLWQSRRSEPQPKKIITTEKRIISTPVVHLQSPLVHIHILKFTQSFGLEPKALWPNEQPKVIAPAVAKQAQLSQIQIQPQQRAEKPGLKFTPLFSDSSTQELKKLWPNRQHRYVHPVFVDRIVYVQKSLPHTPSLNLTGFFSQIIHPYELLTQHVFQRPRDLSPAQPKRAMTSQKKIIPPATVSLQAPLSLVPISVQSVALLGDVGHTQLVMRLSQTPFYTVSTDSSHQTITLMIDNVNPDISTIPPLDTQGTAIQNIVFNVAPGNKLLVTLSLLPQMEIQGLRFIDNNLVLDAGVETQIPYVHPQNAASSSSDAVQLMVKTPSPMTPDEAASENYDEAVDLVNQKNMEGAAGLLEMVVAEHPDYLDARILLARVKLDQSDAAEALTLLQGAVSQPDVQDNTTYYDLLAESYRQTGDLKSALKVYRQLLAMDSSNGAWWVGLGMCFEGLHQSAASVEAYQRAQLSRNLSPLLQDFVAGKLGSIK